MSRSNSKTCNRTKVTSRQMILLLLAVFAVAGIAFAAEPACADSGGFTTEAYNVQVETTEDHIFHVSEEIQVNFYEPRHGLYRYIPKGGKYYDVRNIQVEGYYYDVYDEGGSRVVQIGSGDFNVYGDQTYRITYDIVGYLDDDETKDMLSLDLLPTGWPTAIKTSMVTVTFPKPVDDIHVYSGAYGNAETEDYFVIMSGGSEWMARSRSVLPAGTGLTIKADLPEGYWVNPESRDYALPGMYGILGVLGMLMLLLWLFIGRDDPVIETVEFYPPEEMDPLEIAYIGNDRVSAKDIAAQFMYYANQGYVEIESEGEKKFYMTRLKDIDLGEPVYSRNIFHTLFAHRDHVSMRSLPEEFGEVASGINSEVKDCFDGQRRTFSQVSLAGRIFGLLACFLIPFAAGLSYAYLTYFQDLWGLIVSAICTLVLPSAMASLVAKTDAFRSKRGTPRIVVGFIVVLAVICLEAMAIAAAYPLLALVFALSALAAVVATIFVRRRMNNEIYGRVLGFRNFIATAEYDRLKMLSDENPSYFFNILPYAFIFGMSTRWMDKFADFNIPEPTWYRGPGGYDPMFGHWWFVSTGNGLNHSVTAYHQTIGQEMFGSDSGGGGFTGGFGGGGFSGGGFGGGGGGSW